MKEPDVIWVGDEVGGPEYIIEHELGKKARTFRNTYQYFVINQLHSITKFELIKEEDETEFNQ